ncbi:MAG: FtsX-like permease family protein, partial [Chloroflexota bacterium]
TLPVRWWTYPMRTLLRKLLRDARARKLRTTLTFLGVLLGVAGVVTIATTTRTMAEAQRETYDGRSQADLVSFTGEIPETIASLIERQENVSVVETRSVTSTRFTSGDGWENLRLIGTDEPGAMELDVAELREGRFPRRGEIAFDESARALADIEIGDIVAVQRSAANEPAYFTVVGFTRSPATLDASILNRATAYTSAVDVQRITGRSADNYILIRVSDRERASQTASEISDLLNKRDVSVSGFTVRDPNEFIGSRELTTLLLLLQVFSILGAVLAGFIVANTVLAIMNEELVQIGIVKSLGGVQRQIALTYLAFSGGIGLLGAFLGLALGSIAARQLSGFLADITGLQLPPWGLTLEEVGLALLIGLLVTLAAAVVPAIRGVRRWPATILRPAGIQGQFQSGLLRRLTQPLSRFDTTLASGVRNTVRRPIRALLTIAVISVAVASFVATQALSGSVNGTVDELYDLYGADGWIFFRTSTDISFARELGSQPEVLKAESWTSADAAIGSTRTDVWGMPSADPLYDYRLIEGRWHTRSSPVEVVLTSNLAEKIGVRSGATITLDVGERRQQVQIVGIVNDSSTYLGSTTTGKVFMPLEDINRITARGERADVFALELRSSDPRFVDAALERLEEKYAERAPGTLAAYADQESAREAIDILTVMLSAMVVVVGLVGVAGIINTLLINVTERRREFGILRSVGARNRHVVSILIGEGMVLAVVGLVIGVALGLPLAQLLVDITGQQLFDLTFYLSVPTLLVSFGIALGVVAAAATIPGLIAARMKPVQVLRYE